MLGKSELRKMRGENCGDGWHSCEALKQKVCETSHSNLE